MTLKVPFPNNLTEIDALTRSDHSHLTESDSCYFLGEYTSYGGYACSPTNDLIINIKMSPNSSDSRLFYKNRDIQVSARALFESLDVDWLESSTFVPIPPSKSKSDPEYDDRMTKILANINPNQPVDFRELIIQKKSTQPVHHGLQPRDPDLIRKNFKLAKNLLKPEPEHIIICDDVLTTGAHYRAAVDLLRASIGDDIPICGVFIARRVP